MWNLARYFRKRYTSKYPERFVQGMDYKELYDDEKYRYEMTANRVVWTKLTTFTVCHEFFSLSCDGRLTIFKGYRSDGPSGLTVDTPSFMRSAFTHDVFFQMLREWLFGDLTEAEFQAIFKLANQELQRLSCEDGMMWPRHYIVESAVQQFGEKHARPTQHTGTITK